MTPLDLPFLALSLFAASGRSAPPETIYTNASVWTGAPSQATAEAIARVLRTVVGEREVYTAPSP